MGTLAFRNPIQKALFVLELSGQISDGQWENLAIENHWQLWCDADVIVDPTNLGRDFEAPYERYDFVAEDLLEVVGDRMLAYARLARVFGEKVSQFDYACDLRSTFERGEVPDYFADNPDQVMKIKAALDSLGLSLENIKSAINDPSFTMEDLRRELRDMKKIKKMRRKPVQLLIPVV